LANNIEAPQLAIWGAFFGFKNVYLAVAQAISDSFGLFFVQFVLFLAAS
jgi:hypothetical protein